MSKKHLTYIKKTPYDILNKADFMRQCANVSAVGDWDILWSYFLMRGEIRLFYFTN